MKDLPIAIVTIEALVDIHHSSSYLSDRGKAGDWGKKKGKDID